MIGQTILLLIDIEFLDIVNHFLFEAILVIVLSGYLCKIIHEG